MIYKVDFEGQACKQIKEKAESYQYDLKSVLKGIGLLIADMWLPGDSKPQINTWEGLFEKVQEDYSYKDTIVENDFICSISNDDGISIIIEIADETIVDFKDIKSSILQVRDFLLANKWSGAIPDFLPIEQKEIRNMMNETERSIPFKCLHEAFFECAYRFPDKTALEWLSLDEKWETLSYEALKIKVLQTASMLKQEGVHTRDKVAIVLPKGENQIIAVLAILSIGATYVPIGIHQPLDRKKKIFEAGNISYALTDRDHINTLDGADTLRSFLIENSFRYVVMPETEIVKDIDSIAYIIFTSGTTGIPKGVMITHKAAYNTIYDVNDKFTINEHDCAIAVSELDFDLSVYDIFGMLGYGASLIVLNEMNKREPYIWKKILCEKRVTIWNSVPALFEMFLLAIGYDYEKVTLKNILLSGDWIKLEIYPKVNKLWPECRFVSLGGATEAAIWSVYYEVHILDEPWTSIPYGRPLANQLLRVVNNKGKDSPVGVPGELWIGGYGVAEGYVNEEKLTQERFVKIDGIRWYKTGDKAQYFQDGNVQFLGRLDDQVKVNGYRIELGEIENVIKRAECIDDAIAMTVETNGKKEIVAAVVEKYEKGNACIIDEIFLEFVEDIKRISENNKANSTNDFVTKVWGNILTKEIITKSVVPDLLKNIDLKQIKILDYAQELCPPDVKGQVYVSESEIMNDRNKTYYKILEHPLYGRMADTGIIGVLTHDGYMEFVVPNCETSVETPDKKEDTHEEEIEKPIVKEIMKIWKEVFEIEDISIQDDFYTLGGDSIILMRLVDEMCKTLGCDVTVDDILQSENISDLANRV